jgi:hypothetical protein
VARRRTGSSTPDGRRLGRIETVGAWLRLWTPPRDAVVPPVPWRRIGVGAALAALLLGGAAALVVPAIDTSKREADQRERVAAARRATAERGRITREQAAHYAAAPRPAGANPLPVARERRARRELLARVRNSITRDARARARRGELQGRTRFTRCDPAPASAPRRGAETTLARTFDAYDCLAITGDIPRSSTNVAGQVGYPFRAVVDFRLFRYAWCKTNPVAGERAVPDPRLLVPLPRACTLRSLSGR